MVNQHLGPEYYVELYSNSPLYSQEERIKLLCRCVSSAGDKPTEDLKLRIDLLRLNEGSQRQGAERTAFDFFHSIGGDSLAQTASGFFAASVGGRKNPLPPGQYSLGRVHTTQGQLHQVREATFLVLPPEHYEIYWKDVLNEAFARDGRIDKPENIVACIRDLAQAQGAGWPNTVDLAIKFDFTLMDRRNGSALQLLPETSRGPFEWYHHHLLQAAYNEVFHGGTIALTMVLEERGLFGEMDVTCRLDEAQAERPLSMHYVEHGMPFEVRSDWSRLSEQQTRVSWHYPYDDKS